MRHSTEIKTRGLRHTTIQTPGGVCYLIYISKYYSSYGIGKMDHNLHDGGLVTVVVVLGAVISISHHHLYPLVTSCHMMPDMSFII